MIKTFKDREIEKIFNLVFSRKLPQNIQQVAVRKLSYLHSAKDIKDLTIPPANKLERLSGNRKGQHSIRINDQWRICFKWRNGNAYDEEIVDYH
ncbi:type II toxin-antitoxin system RelE/ParE family toxin [Thermodesulfobacteriota bacterium]